MQINPDVNSAENAKHSGEEAEDIRGNTRERSSSGFEETQGNPKEYSSSECTMNSIDKLTLELLINKSQYKKYMQKNNPAKYSENQVYLGKIQRYRNKIEYMFSTLIENPETQITSDIDRDFTHFVKTCIQYFELKEMENTSTDHNGDPLDDETMFSNIDNSEKYSGCKAAAIQSKSRECSSSEFDAVDASVSSSLWGNKINKSRTTYMPKYTMDSYVSRKKHD